jgi:hypothetical protein
MVFYAPNTLETSDLSTGSGENPYPDSQDPIAYPPNGLGSYGMTITGHGGLYTKYTTSEVELRGIGDNIIQSAATSTQVNGWMPVTVTYDNGLLISVLRNSSGTILNTTQYNFGTTLSANHDTAMYFGFTGRSSEITSETRVRNINFVSTIDTGIKYVDGLVGVGTTTPDYDLDVTGDINFTGNVLKNGVIQSFGIDIIPLIPTLKWSNVTPYNETTLVQLAFDDQRTGTTFTGALSGTQLNAVAQPKIATRLANSAGGYIELTNGGFNLAGTAYWLVTTGDNWSATFDIFISPYYVGQAPADDIRFIFFAPNAPATNDHATGSGGHGGHYIECNFFNADVVSLKDTTDSTVVSASTTLQLSGWMPVTMTYVN